jgi:signal transduction histidine kinase
VRRAPEAAAAAVVLVAQLVLLATIAGNTGERGLDALTGALAALSAVALIARRWSPLGAFVASTLASSALHAVTAAAGPPLAATLALYWLAAAPDDARPRTPVLVAVVGAMLAVHAAAGAIASEGSVETGILWGLLVWGGAWFAGDRARLRRERMARLEERAERNEREAQRERRLAAAEERARIARELHDSAGHAINVILVHAGLGRMRAERNGDAARAEFETIEQVARETVSEIDQLVGALRADDPPLPTEPAAPPGLAALDRLVERQRAAGIEVGVRVRGERRPLPAVVDRGAYRLLQEALTNAARHGAGDTDVEIVFEGRDLAISVTNPTPPGRRPREGGGHGLIGMRERAELLGGSFEAGPREGRYEVSARLPIAAAER